MSYKIVVDSPCDFTEAMRSWDNIARVPLTLQVGDYKILDDENFDQDDFVKRMQAYDDAAKSACPSIESWLKAYEEGDYDEIYVVTITGELSGTYNSAVQAKRVYEEENGMKKKIHVFDSRATSVKETLIAVRIKKLADSGMKFEDIVSDVNQYIKDTQMYFFLDDLENLRKNGRLSNLQASVFTALHVKLICKEVNGNIDKITQEISSNRAVLKLCDVITKSIANIDASEYTLAVSHCYAPERGQVVLDRIGGLFGNAYLIGMSGLNTLYANVGGIIVAYGKS